MTDNDAEPSKAELIEKVDQLESEQQTLKSQLKRMMPSRRDALKAGAAATVGIGALGVTSDTAESATGSAGTIGSSSDRPDIFADEINANQLTGSTPFFKTKTRAFLSSPSSADPIPLDSVSYDPDGNFNGPDYIVPTDGTYQVHFGARVTVNQTGRLTVQLSVNSNSLQSIESRISGKFASTNSSGIFELSANDSVTLSNPRGRSLDGRSDITYLTVIRID
jgi:hypothetical protein